MMGRRGLACLVLGMLSVAAQQADTRRRKPREIATEEILEMADGCLANPHTRVSAYGL